MPKREEPVPWAASQAAASQPYPRKNLYFSGPGMDELFDYCIWQAHIKRHRTIFGKPARTSPEVIADLVARDYLKTMREPENVASFAAWRTRHIGPQKGIPLLLVLAIRETLDFLPARLGLSQSTKEWQLNSKHYQQLQQFCQQVRNLLGPRSGQRKRRAS